LIPLVPLLLELGELLPDVEPAGPQSFIAVCDPLVSLELAPGLVDDPLALGLLEPELEPVVEPLVLPLELVEPDGLFAKELPGPQSVLFIAPLVPVLLLVPGLVLVEPRVPLVCTSAAVPSDRARIDAAIRTRRFIRCPPCASEASPGTLPARGAGPEKKKGRTEMRPKFREEKPEGLAMRTGGPASHRTKRIGPSFSTNG
jgi:hypothetical protein